MEKLITIQQKLQCNKSQFNSFSNYYYRNCEDILEAVKPILNEVKAVLTITDDIVQIGERFYVKATAALFDVDGHVISSVWAFAREPVSKTKFDEAQVTGASSSYARKYALNGLFCIDDTKDADSQDNTQSQKESAPVKMISNEQAITLTELGADIPALCKFYHVQQINDLTYQQAEQAIIAKRNQGNKQ